MTIAIVAMNSLHRPYRESVDIILSLRKDGVLWFFVRILKSVAMSMLTTIPFQVLFGTYSLVRRETRCLTLSC